ncbi:hypothetical protein LOZ53_004540 [Ophidiomyces ophidiicola]|uniref:Uncharacterized protein n=1 Tax=Ophidiomyces ophidiicola TaxID=1387563 RepID=A0ACB8UNC3_9EURO|nr:uncharacterized protein LOZ57_002600 [Ophidiomyces ophidiicola]KAI1919514.1 hypothetical protein LOZ64_002209 [Ophidiomyces ophidiicola]KAI1934912.1 hypothetical protein LOZ62_006115 [Ophidiomyces ophidiicola]KAI1949228.1 hypothetical protein LOZ57_002600 [Ophidiomyces ophidiicola]KAI1967456.1 hypothetical protein LOZ59_000828 [Ophidiomyces ophidiicola]KAI1974783.1 hypothetical protein LOZ56_001085 [Ophidiomyces ophidiicola]
MSAFPNQESSHSAPLLSLTPAQFARLQPHTYVYAHLSPSSDHPRPSTRINGRSESQFRAATVNTGSLTHANGSAVVRIGETTAVCGVRGEILSTDDIPAWSISNTSSGSTAKSPREESTEDDDDTEIQVFNLLVPNLSLSTGCSPAIAASSAPSSLAQSLSHQLLSLLHTSRLIRSRDLRIWSSPNRTPILSQEHSDVTMEDAPASTEPLDAPEIKAFWTLYIDVLIISLAGNPFDAAWAAVVAALRDTRLPKAWWDIDNEMILCSDCVSESTTLQLRGMPISSSFAVFEADPVNDWRKIIVDCQHVESNSEDSMKDDNKTESPKKIKRWILADPDAFEESLCQERACIVVDKSSGASDPVKIIRMEKSGGFYIGKNELKELVNSAAGRWEEWRGLLDGV